MPHPKNNQEEEFKTPKPENKEDSEGEENKQEEESKTPEPENKEDSEGEVDTSENK